MNGSLLKKMIIYGANALNEKKRIVDGLNVFPVPDGDTGTNMSLTALAAAKEVEKSNSLAVGEVAKILADGALRGARGNSGVILSQLFRGFARGLQGLEEADAAALGIAAEKAVEAAYLAVMKPKEGTILTVARAMADEAMQQENTTDSIANFLKQIVSAGQTCLQNTREMLPALQQAGVVDAGGQGLLYFLEGAWKHIDSEEVPTTQEAAHGDPQEYTAIASVENHSITFGYCTEFFISCSKILPAAVMDLKTFLTSIGDSLIVVQEETVIKIHVHTDHPGLAIEKALQYGALDGLKIDNMRTQHRNQIQFADANPMPQPKQKDAKPIGVVAVSAGEGFSKLFQELHADEVIACQQTMNPSAEDFLQAIERVPSSYIIILPNHSNVILAAKQAADLCTDKTVVVLPSQSLPEGLAAMLCLEETVDPTKVFQAMEAARLEIVTCQVTHAAKDTEWNGIAIQQGDMIGFLQEDIVSVDKSLERCVIDTVKKAMKPDMGCLSIYYGLGVTQEKVDGIVKELGKICIDWEIETLYGGQEIFDFILSLE